MMFSRLSLLSILSAVPLIPAYAIASPRQLVENGIAALGGRHALDNMQRLTYEVPTIYRSQSLMQSYNMLKSDVYIAEGGSQNISYAFTSTLQQRIDRRFTRSAYWYFANPQLEPIEFSLVTQHGQDSFASYLRGNNDVFASPTMTAGYQDNGLVEYLKRQSQAMSPKLLSEVADNKAYSSSYIILQSGVMLPAVHDSVLNLTIIFDPETNLPYIIRTYEDHYVYGPSTRDIQLTKYHEVEGISFPKRISTIYSFEDFQSVIEDFRVGNIQVNPVFPPDFFCGDLVNCRISDLPPPVDPNEYSQSEIGEYFDNMLWDGVYSGTFGNIIAAHPLPELPQLWHLMFPDAVNYENLILELDNGVIVLDAPPHQSQLIIKWVKKNINRPITHIWTTHHHHDHSGGVPDFTSIGATLIIPAVAEKYWKISIPNATVITYNDTHPYIHHDKNIQLRFLWQEAAVHAVDWSYAIVTAACPGPNNGIVAFEADAWSPGTDATRFDVNFARQWLRQAERDGLSRDARVVAVHGRNRHMGSPLTDLIDVTGYMYPALNTTSWNNGGGICLN